ncbi:MAG: glycosyltransferase [Deltaproteobacteria bacterium]|nr:glycosyltransferase [Deltaproteobacteria bacterium]
MSNSTTVVHLTTVHKVPDPRIFLKECASLSKAGYNVQALACIDTPQLMVAGVPVFSVGTPTKNRMKRLLYQGRILAALWRHPPALVHFHDPELLPAMLLASLLLARRTKFIFDMHENYGASMSQSPYTRLLRPVYNLCLRASEFRMHLVLAEESYRSLCHKPHQVIHNYPIAPPAQSPSQRHNQIVYLGTIGLERGILEMIEAFALAQLNDWKLVIIGAFDDHLLHTRVRALVRQHKLEARVEFRGYLSAPEALQLVSESRIGLALLHPIPNYLNSLPTKVFEYLCRGTPVLLSNFPFYQQFFRDVPGVHFVDPLNAQEIAKALQKLAVAAPLTTEETTAVLQQYSWESESRRLIDLYTTLDVPRTTESA